MSFCPNCANPIYGNFCTRCGFESSVRPPIRQREICPTCGGRGELEYDVFGFRLRGGGMWRKCQNCSGRGYL